MSVLLEVWTLYMELVNSSYLKIMMQCALTHNYSFRRYFGENRSHSAKMNDSIYFDASLPISCCYEKSITHPCTRKANSR